MKAKLPLIIFIQLLLIIPTQLKTQIINNNEYIILNEPISTYSLYTQYSPIEKGWVLFKFDENSKNYVRQQFFDKSSNQKISLFENLYIGNGSEIITNDGKNFKEISPYSDTIEYSYKSIFLFGTLNMESYSTPNNVHKFRHIIGKNLNNTYCSITEMGMDCDTFEIINGNFIPLFFTDNPNFSENIYRKNGYIVPPLFYVEPVYFYSINKKNGSYELSDVGIDYDNQAFFINNYDSLDCSDRKPQSRKTFPAYLKLSYGTSESFLISIDNKWYLCHFAKNKQILRAYLANKNDILPSDKSLYSYFGNLDATSIKILNWDSGKPVYFIARQNGNDYLYDYRQAEIKSIEETIVFPKKVGISGEIIKPYFIDKEKPYCIEVRNKKVSEYFIYKDGGFTRINYDPFQSYFKAIFTESSYKKFSDDILATVVEERTYSDKDIQAVSETEAVSSLIDSRDGKSYKTIKIGNQTWMAENLNYKGVPYITSNDEYAKKYGVCYTSSIATKVCPKGWRIPSIDEYEKMFIQVNPDSKKVIDHPQRIEWEHIADYLINKDDWKYFYSSLGMNIANFETSFTSKINILATGEFINGKVDKKGAITNIWASSNYVGGFLNVVSIYVSEPKPGQGYKHYLGIYEVGSLTNANYVRCIKTQ